MTSPALHLCHSCGVPLAAGASLGLCGACSFREALLLDDAETLPDGVLRRVGDYDLLEETGRGGMGVVYRARQRSLDRTVAVKVLLGGGFAGEEGRRRFRAEAAAAARLAHPGIVAIHEAGEADGQPFYSMDFIEGETLAARLRRGPLPFRAAAALMEQIAAALHAAHAQGVLHRDLKPSNVLLDGAGAPHVTDFGLAKILNEARSPEDGITHSHQIVGSPAWMAPEQAAGKAALTAAADVYAAGAVFYEMLTGRPPFHGETAQAVMEQVQNAEPVPPRRLNASIPADLDTVCLQCLEKEPHRRYASAAALAEDLRRFLAGEPVLARLPGVAGRLWRWARRHRAAAAVLTAVLLALGTVTAVLSVTGVRVSRARAVAEQRAEESRRHLIRSHVIAGTNFMERDDTQRALPFLMEAMRMEEGASGEAHRARIATAVLHSPQPVKMWRAGGIVSTVRFSSDGQRLVCTNDTPLVRVWSADPADGSETVLQHDRPAQFASFNKYGTRLVTGGATTAQLWDAQSHQRIGPPLPHAGNLTAVDQKRPPVFSADGAFLLTCAGKVLRRWSAADGSAQGAEINAGAFVTAHCFLPGGGKVLAATSRSEVMLFDAVTGARLSSRALPEAARALSTDSTALRAAAICGKNRVVIFQPFAPDQPPVEGLHSTNGYAYQADFLPGDERVLSCSYDGTVRLWNAADARQLDMLKHPGGVTGVRASGTGSRAVSECWDGAVRLAAVNGFRLLCSPMMHTGPVSAVDTSPAGDTIVSAGYDDTVRLWRIAVQAQVSTRGLLQPDDWQPGRAAARWTTGGAFTVITPETGARLIRPVNHGAPILQLSLSHAAQRIAILDTTGITVWNTASAASVCRIPLKSIPASRLLLSQDGTRVLAQTGRKSVSIFSAHDGSTAATIALPAAAHDLALSPDGRWLATAGADGKARVWSTADGTLRSGPFGESDGVQSLTWSHDSRRLAAASGPASDISNAPRTLRVFDAATGQPLTPPMPHNDDIQAVAFSPDDRWLATGCEDMQARLFDAGAGTLSATPMSHGGFVHAVAFNDTGTLLASAAGDSRIHLWEVPGGQSAGHPINTSSNASRLFFSPGTRHLTGAYPRGENTAFRTAVLETSPPSGLTLHDYLTAVSGFRLNPAGDLEPLPAHELHALWQRLAPEP